MGEGETRTRPQRSTFRLCRTPDVSWFLGPRWSVSFLDGLSLVAPASGSARVQSGPPRRHWAATTRSKACSHSMTSSTPSMVTCRLSRKHLAHSRSHRARRAKDQGIGRGPSALQRRPHSSTLARLRGLRSLGPVAIIEFDAHTDCAQEYLGPAPVADDERSRPPSGSALTTGVTARSSTTWTSGRTAEASVNVRHYSPGSA